MPASWRSRTRTGRRVTRTLRRRAPTSWPDSRWPCSRRCVTYQDAEHRVGSSLLSRLADDLWSGVRAGADTAVGARCCTLPEHDLTPLAELPRVFAMALPDGSPVLHDLGRGPLRHDPAARVQRSRPGPLDPEPGPCRRDLGVVRDGCRRPAPRDRRPAGHQVVEPGAGPRRDQRRARTCSPSPGAARPTSRACSPRWPTRASAPHTEVMLVGHSEGGIVAVDAARDAAASGRFRITHVVTAGSPVGDLAGELPTTVQLLALENTADVVPALDNARQSRPAQRRHRPRARAARRHRGRITISSRATCPRPSTRRPRATRRSRHSCPARTASCPARP